MRAEPLPNVSSDPCGQRMVHYRRGKNPQDDRKRRAKPCCKNDGQKLGLVAQFGKGDDTGRDEKRLEVQWEAAAVTGRDRRRQAMVNASRLSAAQAKKFTPKRISPGGNSATCASKALPSSGPITAARLLIDCIAPMVTPWVLGSAFFDTTA